MPLPPPNASGSSFGVADANNKSAAVAVPCCSSSSDEAETDPNGAGWPSVVSVLETPDRRRVRKSLRAVVAASTSASSANNLPHASIRPAPAPAILVRSPQRKRPALAAAHAPPTPAPLLLFTSPPPPPARKARLHSPTLRTPKCSRNSDAARHVHLSRSPMSAFFVRLAAARPPVAGDCSPKSASSSSSSSGASTSSASPASVLMPLNMHNYIGIRFSGEQPDGVTRHVRLAAANASSSSSSGTTDENATPPPASSASGPRKSSASASDDSGFLDASCSSASDRSATTTLIETPSKGLARTSDASTSAEAASCSSASSSAQFLLSELDQHHRLMSSIHHHHHSPHSTASIIAEQSYGPLEASVLDGILNDLSMWPSSPRKTPAKPARSSPMQHRRCSSALFEAKLAALAAAPATTTASTSSSSSSPWNWSCSATPRGIPSSLLVELDEEEEAEDHHDHGDEEAETTRRSHTFNVMFPDLDQRSLDHMFGTGPDQLEVTRMAHAFLQRARSGVLSAGVPAGFSAHCRLRLD